MEPCYKPVKCKLRAHVRRNLYVQSKSSKPLWNMERTGYVYIHCSASLVAQLVDVFILRDTRSLQHVVSSLAEWQAFKGKSQRAYTAGTLGDNNHCIAKEGG